jgi:hypothetical protein
MFGKSYLLLGTLLVCSYGVSSFTGWEWTSARRQYIPAGVRQQPGGYRSFHFWHSGYRGGK